MRDYGVKIAKPGFDARTTGLNNLVFNSSYPLLKIKQKGQGTATLTNNSTADSLVTIHNLGYQPLFRFSIQWYDIDLDAKDSSYRSAPFLESLSNGSVNFKARPYTDNVGLRLQLASSGVSAGTHTLQYYYVIYYDQDI